MRFALALALGLGLALAGCSAVPHAGDTVVANVRCETVGQGIALEADVTAVLDAGQHVQIDVAFVDDSTITQSTLGEIWMCGPWSEIESGAVVVGCGRGDAGQPDQAQLDYRFDQIIVDGTLPIPPRVRVTPVVFAPAPDTDSATGDGVETDCTSP